MTKKIRKKAGISKRRDPRLPKITGEISDDQVVRYVMYREDWDYKGRPFGLFLSRDCDSETWRRNWTTYLKEAELFTEIDKYDLEHLESERRYYPTCRFVAVAINRNFGVHGFYEVFD